MGFTFSTMFGGKKFIDLKNSLLSQPIMYGIGNKYN
jgi:hypothetical protein